MFKKIWVWLGDMPSTNTRIFCTLFLFVTTAARYQISGITLSWGKASLAIGPWSPSWEWCVLLAAAMGIDAAQFAAKRATFKPASAPDTEDRAAG